MPEISFGVKPGTVAECRKYGYFREVLAQVRVRRFCGWTGEKLAIDGATTECAGYHTGEWGQLWAV